MVSLSSAGNADGAWLLADWVLLGVLGIVGCLGSKRDGLTRLVEACNNAGGCW